MGPISKKVIAGLKKAKNQKIIQFDEFKEAKVYAGDLEKSVATEEQLSDHDPLHAIYIYAQNRVSVLVEQLADLKPLSKLTNTLDQADEIYLPSSPPQSPLTQSYFTCWGFFDLSVGIKKESFGTVIIDLLKYLKADPGLIKIIECMQNSRMGIFIHRGNIDRYVILEELITGEEVKVFVPAGSVAQHDKCKISIISINGSVLDGYLYYGESGGGDYFQIWMKTKPEFICQGGLENKEIGDTILVVFEGDIHSLKFILQ